MIHICQHFDYLCSECYRKAPTFRPKVTTIKTTMTVISITSIIALIIILIAYNLSTSSSDVYHVTDTKPDTFPFYCDSGLANVSYDIWMIGIAS